MSKIMETNKMTVVACSGASNTGEYSDVVARRLKATGQAEMLCLARFSIDEKFTEKSKSEIQKLVVLDGCPVNCAELIMKKTGIRDFIHINTTDFGVVKGKTHVEENKINEIVDHIKTL